MKLVSLILFPIKLICSVCSLIFRCDTNKYKMNCLGGQSNPIEARRLAEKLKIRKFLDKKLLESANKLFRQSNSGGVSRATQGSFESWLFKADQAHQDLINYAKPYLTEEIISCTFINEKLSRKAATLENEYGKLQDEFLLQKERYENIIKNKTKAFYEEKKKVEQRNADLEEYCKFLETEKTYFQNHAYEQNKNNTSYEQLETMYKRKDQQFSETLKAQNDLVSDLKRQLAESKMEQEHLKRNLNLVQKQTRPNSSNEVLLNQKNTVLIENEKKKAIEQRNLEQRHSSELQGMHLEYANKIRNLEIQLAERNQLLQNLHQQKKILQNQLLQFEGNSKKEWHFLEDKYNAQGTLIDNLEKRLSYIINERDNLKTHIVNLQQETEQQVRNLTDEIILLRGEGKYLTAERPQARTIVQQDNNVGENKKHQERDYGQEALLQIENIFENTRALEEEVKGFSGTKEDKTFLHLQELLIRDIVSLDNVDSRGNFDLRKRRKEAIQYAQVLLNILKEKT